MLIPYAKGTSRRCETQAQNRLTTTANDASRSSYYIQYDTKIVVEVVVAAAAALLQGGMINVARSKDRRELFCIIKANQSIARAVSVVLTTKT